MRDRNSIPMTITSHTKNHPYISASSSDQSNWRSIASAIAFRTPSITSYLKRTPSHVQTFPHEPQFLPSLACGLVPPARPGSDSPRHLGKHQYPVPVPLRSIQGRIMKSRYALFTATAISIVVAQPAMATTLTSSQLDQMLQNIAIPIAMVMSVVLAITIFSSGQLSYLQRGKGPGNNREVMGLAFISLALCSLPSLILGQFGTSNLALLLINGVCIAFGLMIRSQ